MNAAKKELSAEEKATVEKALRKLLLDALKAQTDPKKRLDAEAFKPAEAAIGKSKLQATTREKTAEELTESEVKEAVRTYIEDKPSLRNRLRPLIAVDDVIATLDFKGGKGGKFQFQWSYRISPRKKSLTGDEKRQVENGLTRILNGAIADLSKHADPAKRLPASEYRRLVDAILKPDFDARLPYLSVADVNSDLVRQLVREYLAANPAVLKPIEGVIDVGDAKAGGYGLVYDGDAPVAQRYRWSLLANPNKKELSDEEKSQAQDPLRQVLYEAFRAATDITRRLSDDDLRAIRPATAAARITVQTNVAEALADRIRQVERDLAAEVRQRETAETRRV